MIRTGRHSGEGFNLMSSHFGDHENANEVDGASGGGYHRIVRLVRSCGSRAVSSDILLSAGDILLHQLCTASSLWFNQLRPLRIWWSASVNKLAIRHLFLVQAQHQRVNSEDCRHQLSYQNLCLWDGNGFHGLHAP